MFKLERTRRIRAVGIFVCVLLFLLSGWGWAKGGSDLLEHGFLNEPFPCIAMISAAIGGVLALLFCLGLSALEKDVTEHLKCLNSSIPDTSSP